MALLLTILRYMSYISIEFASLVSCHNMFFRLVDACGGVIFSPSSWEPQEKGMMNIAARFSHSKKPRFIDLKGNKPND
jgi:hypothetical protein